ncbi:hypothetical protein, partial [Ralstonia pseudosolanacearum]|uniref:hypothetical protein n=1 Tax=Ralstonia pseudosolanacearum TaxID=1310165 RepID=UPI003CF5DCD9
RTPSVSPEFKIIGGPVSSNSIYATTPVRYVTFIATPFRFSLVEAALHSRRCSVLRRVVL